MVSAYECRNECGKELAHGGKVYVVSTEFDTYSQTTKWRTQPHTTGRLRKEVIKRYKNFIKERKKEEETMSSKMDELQMYINPTISLDCCQEAPSPQKKKEETMSNMYAQTNLIATNPDATKIEYLSERLSEIECNKTGEASEKFYINWTDKPKTPAEAIQRIKDGKFSYNPEYANEDGTWKGNNGRYYQASAAIDWRTIPEDQAGYDAYIEKMYDARQKTSDAIHILSPADGLAALQAFESSTIN